MKRFIVMGAIAAVAAVIVPASARIDDTCSREDVYATFVQPAQGQLIVTPLPGNSVSVTGPAGEPIFVSGTGEIEVIIDYGCMMNLTLTVTKTDPVPGGDPYVTTWGDEDLNGPIVPGTRPECERDGQLSESVPIGLNGGQYSFELTGESCNPAVQVRQTQGGLVGDPPLPL